jgi:hypothetical protein
MTTSTHSLTSLMENQMINDAYMQLLAEEAGNRQEALNVLARIQFYESRRRMKEQALRAQYIQPGEITG